MRTFLFILAAGSCLPVFGVSAETILVPDHFPTIQQAIDAASDFDEVLVADGVYSGPENRALHVDGKSITVRSANGPANCIIHCEDADRAFYLVDDDPAEVIIRGFTMTRGYVDGDSPSGRKGGAVFCSDSSPLILDCIFDDNQGHTGGAIYCERSDAVIANCVIINQVGKSGDENEVHNGGGIHVRLQSDVTVVNCTIADNILAPGQNYVGGGIQVNLNSAVTVVNSILAGNSATNGDQLSVCNGSTLNVRYSNVESGRSGVFIDDATLDWQAGNIDVDPRFCACGDYSISAGSPCIDAGENKSVPPGVHTDIAGSDRFADDPDSPDRGSGDVPVVDMGAFEFIPQMTCQADLSRDGIVDTLDLLDLLGQWGPVLPGTPADLNTDGIVDSIDLLSLLAEWGPCE